MKFKYIAIILLFVGACTDLEEELYHELSQDNFYQNQDEVVSGFLRSYTQLRQTYVWNPYYLQELTTDEACFPQKGRDGYDGGTWQRLHWHTWSDQETVIRDCWNDLYKGVGFCNSFLSDLEGIDIISEEERILFTSETKALRAFYYFLLVDLFGNIPIVTDLNTLSPTNVTRTEAFNFIESELTENRDNLLSKGDDGWYGRITKETIDAILSRLYLNAEVYTGTERWDDCIKATQRVINASFTLENDWKSPFLSNNDQSEENIFAIPCDEVFANDFEPLFTRQTHWAQRPQFDWQGSGGWNGICTVREFIETFDTINDDRCKYDPQNGFDGQFMWGPQYDLNNEPILATNEFAGQQLNFTLDVPNMVDGKENAGARNIKYRVDIGASGMSNDFVLFRLAEMYFNLAEANLRKSGSVDPVSLAGINQIRTRADVPEYADLTLEELYDEKGREMCYETIRRSDMIRFGTFLEPMWDKEYTDEQHYTLFPIPFDQININPNLKQNPGY